MSGLKLRISQRGGLSLLATFILLIAMVIAAPGVSSARAAVKQFTASISPATAIGQLPGTWTETVTNCGGTPIQPPCTRSSTIALGTIQIAVPSVFRPVTLSTPISPSGQPQRNWFASYDSGTGTINANAIQGADKLQPGESIMIQFSATPSTCDTGTQTFTTSAWGSTPSPDTAPFTLVSDQPTVTINGCLLASGGSVTDSGTRQTETISGFSGHVIVSFVGDFTCENDPDYGDQWERHHLATPVTITPFSDFGGIDPKISTSEFPHTGGRASDYLVCYAVPIDAAHPDPFATRGGGTATEQGGNWVGILPRCSRPPSPPPCVSDQYLTTDGSDMIVISLMLPPGDPGKR